MDQHNFLARDTQQESLARDLKEYERGRPESFPDFGRARGEKMSVSMYSTPRWQQQQQQQQNRQRNPRRLQSDTAQHHPTTRPGPHLLLDGAPPAQRQPAVVAALAIRGGASACGDWHLPSALIIACRDEWLIE